MEPVALPLFSISRLALPYCVRRVFKRVRKYPTVIKFLKLNISVLLSRSVKGGLCCVEVEFGFIVRVHEARTYLKPCYNRP
jgi:hypothetical protein